MAVRWHPRSSTTDLRSSNLHRELLTPAGLAVQDRAVRDRVALAGLAAQDPAAQDPADLAARDRADQEDRAALADRVGLADMSRVDPAVQAGTGPADPVALADLASRVVPVGPADMALVALVALVALASRVVPVDRMALVSLGVRDRAALGRMDRGRRARDLAAREPQDLSRDRAQPGPMPAHLDRAQPDRTRPADPDPTRPADPDRTRPADPGRTPADRPWDPTTRAEVTPQEAEMRPAAATLNGGLGIESRPPPGLLARSASAVRLPVCVSIVASVMRFTHSSQAVRGCRSRLAVKEFGRHAS